MATSSDKAGVELADLRHTRLEDQTTPASVSYQLAHETARELEHRGEHIRAAELISVALTAEAQRINQNVLSSLDLTQHADAFKSTTVALAEQQLLSARLMVPLLDERRPPLLMTCLAVITNRRKPRPALPRPERVLDGLAKRWYLPPYGKGLDVREAWTDFVNASGGSFTLSLASAKQTLFAGQADDVALALWRLALMDTAAADLIVLDEELPSPPASAPAAAVPAAAPAAALTEGRAGVRDDAVAAGGTDLIAEALAVVDEAIGAASVDVATGAAVGMGANGLNFEEYVVLRSFATAESLEEQFRFLWRLVDRDADGALSHDDMLAALQVQRARLGWDDETTVKWAQWALGAVKRDPVKGRVGPKELRAALHKSAQLRTLFMACEPFDTAVAPPRVVEPASSNSNKLDLSAVVVGGAVHWLNRVSMRPSPRS